MKPENYILQTMVLRNQIHLYHRQTQGFGEHKALDAFYNEIIELIDDFVETYQGRYGRIKIEKETSSLQNYSKGAAVKALSAYAKSTEKMIGTTGKKAPELENILQEILGLTNKTVYMLSLG